MLELYFACYIVIGTHIKYILIKCQAFLQATNNEKSVHILDNLDL